MSLNILETPRLAKHLFERSQYARLLSNAALQAGGSKVFLSFDVGYAVRGPRACS